MIIDNYLYKRIKEKMKVLDSYRLLSKDILEKLKHQLEIEMAYNSNAIEGSTLTLNETKLILEEGITIGGKSLKEHLEVINHKKALNFIEGFTKSDNKVNENMILKIHEIILKEISDTWAGRYREGNVRVLGAMFKPAKPYEIRKKMKDLISYINKNPDKLNIIELSAVAHHKLVVIHPFVDGNGRTARLINNLLLMQEGYPLMIVLMNDRKKYYSNLKAADKGDLEPFVNFIARNVERTLAIYLNAIKTTKKTELISLNEATKYCDYGQEYLSLLARRGKLYAIKINRNWMTTREAIEEYVKTHKQRL
jgi:Fic family protein